MGEAEEGYFSPHFEDFQKTLHHLKAKTALQHSTFKISYLLFNKQPSPPRGEPGLMMTVKIVHLTLTANGMVQNKC